MSTLGALDIRPGVGLLAIFPHMNYKPWYALAEFVDNAIQSYLDNKVELRRIGGSEYKLRVVITYQRKDGGTIKVWDNAAGIATKDYRRAFVTAQPPPDATGLSQFGIGMKSAACWFAKNFTVRTTALGESVQRTVRFDVPRIVKDSIDHIAPTEAVVSADEHFTEIELTHLNHMPETRTITKIEDHLRSMYRVFTRRGELELTFNGDELTFEYPDFLEAPIAGGRGVRPEIWRKELSFAVDGSHHAHGFAAILKTGNTKKAGLALFRNDRLVQGSDEDAYRPYEIFGNANSFRYQRVVGELHLVGFDVSHTKDVFLWDNMEGPLLDKLRSEMNAPPLRLLQQAEEFRTRTWEGAQRQAEKAVNAVATAVESAGNVVEGQIDEPAVAPPLAAVAPAVATTAQRDIQMSVHGESWRVTLELTNDPAATAWVDLFDTEAGPAGALGKGGKERRLGIRVALGSPFMVQFAGSRAEHLEPLVRVAVALALAETTARDAGVGKAGVVRIRLNQLLRDALAGPARFTLD